MVGGRGSDGQWAGEKMLILGGGAPKKIERKGGGVGRRKMGGGRGVEPRG